MASRVKDYPPLFHLIALIVSIVMFGTFLFVAVTDPAPFPIVWTVLSLAFVAASAGNLWLSLRQTNAVYEPRCQLEAQQTVQDQMKHDGLL